MVRLVFHFDPVRILRDTEIESAHGRSSGGERRSRLFLPAVIGLCRKTVCVALKRKEGDRTVIFQACILKGKLQKDIFTAVLRLLIDSFSIIFSACHVQDLQIAVLQSVTNTEGALLDQFYGCIVCVFAVCFHPIFFTVTCRLRNRTFTALTFSASDHQFSVRWDLSAGPEGLLLSDSADFMEEGFCRLSRRPPFPHPADRKVRAIQSMSAMKFLLLIYLSFVLPSILTSLLNMLPAENSVSWQ